MAEPASKEDLARLLQMVEALERRLSAGLSAASKQIEKLEETIDAALSAIGDEQVESDSKYNAALLKAINEMQEELNEAYDYIKNCLVEAEVDHQKMRRHFEDSQDKKRYT